MRPNLAKGGDGGGGGQRCELYALATLMIAKTADEAGDAPAYALEWFLENRWPEHEQVLWSMVIECSPSWPGVRAVTEGIRRPRGAAPSRAAVEAAVASAARRALLADVELALARWRQRPNFAESRDPKGDRCARYQGVVAEVGALARGPNDVEDAVEEYLYEVWPRDERELWALVAECSPSFPEDVWALWYKVAARMERGEASEIEVASAHGRVTGAAFQALVEDVRGH